MSGDLDESSVSLLRHIFICIIVFILGYWSLSRRSWCRRRCWCSSSSLHSLSSLGSELEFTPSVLPPHLLCNGAAVINAELAQTVEPSENQVIYLKAQVLCIKVHLANAVIQDPDFERNIRDSHAVLDVGQRVCKDQVPKIPKQRFGDPERFFVHRNEEQVFGDSHEWQYSQESQKDPKIEECSGKGGDPEERRCQRIPQVKRKGFPSVVED